MDGPLVMTSYLR